MATPTLTEPGLLRLLQLASASLPVGGFAYSQGLEYAVQAGWLRNAEAVEDWLQLQLEHSLARNELALVSRLYDCLDAGDKAGFANWNLWLLACRETRELHMTDSAMGAAMLRLMSSLGLDVPSVLGPHTSFAVAFTCAARQWALPPRACALGLAWSWLENQVAAATKLVPLGQTQAQQLLGTLQQAVPSAIDLAFALDDDALGGSLPGLAMASAWHETQYSRLFRS